MTLASVTSLPSLITFAQMLSEAKPLIMVSLSTLFCESPSGYSASLTNLRALVWNSSRLMEPWNSLLNSTIAVKVFNLGEMCSSNSSKYLVMLFLLASVIFSFYFSFVHQFHYGFSRPVDDVVAFNTITSSIE